MPKKLDGKSVVIIGASGGLGSGFAKSFSEKGAKLLLVGRNEEKLINVKNSLNGEVDLAISNVTDFIELEELSKTIRQWSSEVDLIINATGFDVRKSLEDHSLEDVQKQIDINLLGTILITKILINNLKDEKGSTILHIGGFADGRMAFPYYSVDVATRAGVFSFIESINREMEIEGKQVRVTYFCPSPTETEAERPFHKLWKKMGIKIVPVENVADELIRTYEKKRNIGIMGGRITIFFAKVNSVMPKLADAITMKNYGIMLKEYLYGNLDPTQHENNTDVKVGTPSNMMTRIALLLVILSFVFFGLAMLTPLVPLSLAYKATIIPALIIMGEIAWWIGIAIVGKQAVTKYREYLNPCKWFCCKSNKSF